MAKKAKGRRYRARARAGKNAALCGGKRQGFFLQICGYHMVAGNIRRQSWIFFNSMRKKRPLDAG
ncbi:MAG: hypothetical protein J6T92_00100, partial [Ottowia sp.]|nr:hypothetical protein [Ottowia sp.]